MTIVTHQRSLGRTLRRTAIAIGVMLLLVVIAGVAYVYISGRNPKPEQTDSPAVTKEADPLPKPVQPSPNAKEGVAVEALTSPVKAGTNASITIQTNATSKCTISVTYNNVPSTDSGLGPKTADAYGSVTWTWTVTPATPAGSWPISVTCTFNGRPAVVDAKQVVQ